VIYYCCRVTKTNWRELKYTILGDDIVIHDDVVAKKYIETMTLLGLSFSEKKTHISPIMYEFAKRFVHDGREITPFPIGALWSARSSVSSLVNVIDSEFLHKDWDISLGVPEAILELYRFLGYPSRVIKRLKLGIYTVFHILEALSGRKLAAEALKPLLVAFYPSLASLDGPPLDSLSQTLFQTVIREAFLKSANFENLASSLGTKVSKLLGILVSEDTSYDADNLRWAIPHVCIQSDMRARLFEIGGDVDSLYNLVQGNWKDTLRSFTVPISDSIFIQRNQDIKVHAASTLGKILHRHIKDQLETELIVDYGFERPPPEEEKQFLEGKFPPENCDSYHIKESSIRPYRTFWDLFGWT